MEVLLKTKYVHMKECCMIIFNPIYLCLSVLQKEAAKATKKLHF